MKSFLAFLALPFFAFSLPYEKQEIEDKKYWLDVGSTTLDTILSRQSRLGVAKNVIVFIGDGMGIPTVTMARIFQGQNKKNSGEKNSLAMEKFPSVGLAKTYDVSHQVPDSASTATAIFSGVKTKQAMLGLDASAIYDKCNATTDPLARVSGFMTWAQTAGKDTGVVTTARITHATPAAAYAHTNNRDWECDSSIPAPYEGCVKDIARQLVEDKPGKNFKVILGGGRQQFGAEPKEFDSSCKRKDGLNLVELWRKNKTNEKYVTSVEELKTVDETKTDYLLGLFSPGHMKYVGENETSRPSLRTMMETAIKILKKGKNGFALMVEGARIDMAHHENYAKLALLEAVEFDEAIAAAAGMTDPKDTLIIVTADHSHAAHMNGYPLRGNDILGLAMNTQKKFYETITYTNGPGYEYHHPTNKSLLGNCSGDCSEVEKQAYGSIRDIRREPEKETNIYYRHFVGHYLETSSHGGEDVAVFASGPMAHLLVGVYEQSYIGTFISYATCMGPMAHRCSELSGGSAAPQPFLSSVFIYVFIFLMFFAQ